jgi:papain like protease
MTVELVERKTLLVTPNRGFGMGHKVAPMPAHVLPARHLFGATRAQLALAWDLSAYVDKIRDQHQTSKCVGMSLARTCHVDAQFQKFGAPNPGQMPYPSEMGIYDLAREEEDQGALVDEGSSPGLALQALNRDIGVPLERDWPADDSKINDPLPVDALARALAMKVTAAYTIDSAGQQRSDDCAAALIANRAISMAIQVGDNYESCNSDKPVLAQNQGDKIYGGHDITLVGYRTVNGRRQWLNPGSWGSTTGFGFGGWAWLDDGVITDPTASDFIVLQTVPDFSLSAAHKALIADVGNSSSRTAVSVSVPADLAVPPPVPTEPVLEPESPEPPEEPDEPKGDA